MGGATVTVALCVIPYVVAGLVFGGMVSHSVSRKGENPMVLPWLVSAIGFCFWPLFAAALLWGAGKGFARDRGL